MKKAINLIIMYFAFFIVGTIIGTMFYSFYLNVTGFVAGQTLDIWDADILMQALFYVAIAMCFLIFPVLSYYRVRHAGGIPQTITYILLSILTVFVVFPGTVKLKKIYYDHFPVSTHITHLSADYFRQSGDKIYYFTKDFASNPITGEDTTTIVIDTQENGIVSIEEIKDTPEFELYSAAEPFKEILAKHAFSDTITKHKNGITVLVESAEQVFDKGLSFILGFLIVFLAFSSIYAVTSFFQWKLVNAFFLIVNSAIIVFTYGNYKTVAWDGVRNALENNRLMGFLQNYIDAPALMFFYLILSLAFIITGIVTYAVRKHKKKA